MKSPYFISVSTQFINHFDLTTTLSNSNINKSIHTMLMELSMKKKVMFTLPQPIIDGIEKRVLLNSSLTQRVTYSDVVTMYLEYGFMEMKTELNERNQMENPPPMYEIPKKVPNTIPKTYNIPIQTYDNLNFYSNKLGVKKSHLVTVCCKMFERDEDKRLSNQIKELMDSVDESYNSELED
jgi:hypothetical protein